ncbi:MAG: citrate lyase beta subunit [Bacteriovoracia bacterium]
MNVLEREMVELLRSLREQYGVFEIKAEYENEGCREPEMMRLKDVADEAGLPIILKIGGVEAVTDIYSALTLGVNGIIAPMAETAFATSKFLGAVNTFVPEDNQRDIEFAINIETITAYENFDKMLELKDIATLKSITVGRVDFAASLGKDRGFVNSSEMLRYCTEIFTKAKAKGLRTAVGGAISLDSISFIRQLVEMNLLDKYETRKLVFHGDAIRNAEKGLLEGIKFELLWLKSKRRYYHRIKNEDEKRIEMLEKRVAFQQVPSVSSAPSISQ